MEGFVALLLLSGTAQGTYKAYAYAKQTRVI